MNWAPIMNGVWWPSNGSETGVPCNSVETAGGNGITDNTIALDPGGGVITLLFDPQAVVDKMEIIHGPASGAKVATSGMTVPNAGTYDNVYGTEPVNTIPTNAQAAATDQFIGTNSGTVPTRVSQYEIETGIPDPITGTGYQQIVWWVYTTADYQNFSYITVRITGQFGTAWSYERFCSP